MKAYGYWLAAACTVFVNAAIKGIPTGGAVGTAIELGAQATSAGNQTAVDGAHKVLWALIHTAMTAGAFGLHAVIAWQSTHQIPNPYPEPAAAAPEPPPGPKPAGP